MLKLEEIKKKQFFFAATDHPKRNMLNKQNMLNKEYLLWNNK